MGPNLLRPDLIYESLSLKEDEFLIKDIYELKSKMWGSLLSFTRVFYWLRTHKKFEIPLPDGRESHYITICKELSKVFDLKTSKLNINIAPRYGKTELLAHFVAWAFSQFPDCNFIYASYALHIAQRAVGIIRDIIRLPKYKQLFNVELLVDKEYYFKTSSGGEMLASGVTGSITGFGCGITGVFDRFNGCLIIDDSLKPHEAPSDSQREEVFRWFEWTAKPRRNNGEDTPIIHIGQRLHEDDLSSMFINSPKWTNLVLETLDKNNNALDPSKHSVEELLEIKKTDEYLFSAEYQQNPQPTGGGIFKEEDFLVVNVTPDILATFITADTAETDKTYNDKTVFSFWGLHYIVNHNIKTDILGLFWIDCLEINIEIKDLENEFWSFYGLCMAYKIKPSHVAIENESSGKGLISKIEGELQGSRLHKIERPRGISKATRFLLCQPYISKRLISLPFGAKHTQNCIKHMGKITINMTHRFDDIADTAEMAIKLALVDKVIYNKKDNNNIICNDIYNFNSAKMNRIDQLKKERGW